jgi:hypothetical protein
MHLTVRRPVSNCVDWPLFYRRYCTIGALIHGCWSELWSQADSIGIPVPHRDVHYGTRGKAEEVCRLFHNNPVGVLKIFTMGGHEDGIVAFGSSLE